MIVVITDGEADSSPAEISRKLHASGLSIVALGTKEATRQSLELIAYPTDCHLFNDFKQVEEFTMKWSFDNSQLKVKEVKPVHVGEDLLATMIATNISDKEIKGFRIDFEATKYFKKVS